MIYFKGIPKKDPRNANATVSFHACALSSGITDMRAMANKISDRCSMTTADVFAVLENLVTLIPIEIADGKIVQLGDFGTFRLTVKGEGAESPELLTRFSIKEAKIRFRPGNEFSNKLKDLKFVKKDS